MSGVEDLKGKKLTKEVIGMEEIPSVVVWVNEVCRLVEEQGTAETNSLIISDVDDTLFDTSERWFERLSLVCADGKYQWRMQSAGFNMPYLLNFRSVGPRKTFEPRFKAVGLVYEEVRDAMLSESDFYAGIASLVDTKMLRGFMPKNAVWGGYLSGRADSQNTRRVTDDELKKNGFPEAPILLQPEATAYEKGSDYKTEALGMLRQRLDEMGHKDIQIVIVDDYVGNVDKLEEKFGPGVRGILCANKNERYPGKTWDEVFVDLEMRSGTNQFSQLSMPSISAQVGPTHREIANRVASASPFGVGRVLDSTLSGAIYPSQSLDIIEDLNSNFDSFFFHRLSDIVHERFPDRSASALLATYYFSRDIFGPLRAMHTLSVLKEAGAKDTVHFMARDGLPELIVAKHLERDGVVVPEMNYVSASQTLMRQMDNSNKVDQLREYLDQFGFKRPGRHWLVDIGFRGETPHRLSILYPGTDFRPRFLISKVTPELVKERPVMANTVGFAFDMMDPDRDVSFENVVVNDNDQIRMMEDTFGGIKTSSTEIVRRGDGRLVSNAAMYPLSYEGILRRVAMLGIGDAAKIYGRAIKKGMRIEEILSHKDRIIEQYRAFLKHVLNPRFSEIVRSTMFVSHEHTNFDASAAAASRNRTWRYDKGYLLVSKSS